MGRNCKQRKDVTRILMRLPGQRWDCQRFKRSHMLSLAMMKRLAFRSVTVAGSVAMLMTPLLAASTAAQSVQAARQKIDVSRLGPRVGQRVPDFNLNDQNGRAHNLQSIMGSRGAMLVFFRSADW